jgi:ribosomal protein L37AE/L43A
MSETAHVEAIQKALKPKTNKPRCPDCNSQNIIANRSGESYCRKCGASWTR